MRVINIHKRKIKSSKKQVSLMFNTLATKNDKIWPFENWPAIQFKDGLSVGNKGGHGMVRYTIIKHIKNESITFQFTKPDGFIGTHELKILELSKTETEICHEINMRTATFKASVLWVFIVRWLHDALIEEAFDKLENNVSEVNKISNYNSWVKFLRHKYKKKARQIKPV